MFKRFLIVAFCYLLSSIGVLGSLIITFECLHNGSFLIPLIYCFAWVAHMVMCIAWVRSKPLSSYWPIGGTLIGLAGLLAWPIASATNSFVGFLALFAYQVMLVLPLIALAYFLVDYHLATRAPSEIATNT